MGVLNPSTQQVRWGVIGAGGIARRRTIPEGILPARNARLVAIYTPNVADNAAMAREYGVRAAGSVGELLASGVDAVYVASPNDVHREQVLACARAGCHVLCEKPLGLTVAEVVEMMDGCASAGVRLGTAFMMRFHAQHRAALAVIRNGELGRPVFARAQLSCWYPPIAGAWRQSMPRSGGGVVMDLAGHCLDLLEMFFGSVSEVSCVTGRIVQDYEPEDGAVISVRFRNGALGVVDVFFCVPDRASENRLELYGSSGSLLARNTVGQDSDGEVLLRRESGSPDYSPQQERGHEQGVMRLEASPVNIYRAEIEEFSQAILEGREPSGSAELGLRSQRLLEACYRSAREGRSVEVGAASSG